MFSQLKQPMLNLLVLRILVFRDNFNKGAEDSSQICSNKQAMITVQEMAVFNKYIIITFLWHDNFGEN